ncbi:MAG: Preprotein translocase subunit SecD [Parcubacteria group bacterium GW2011_GWA2_42_35]|nr:MAG: Preprotein translocase subunit SecD [Parcubacteria group bacterium GW2011_GWC2_42_13]KKS57731.1 MAG: Preprotein translocase subunit SecD [Parcubacteria group bacterium GW2011_GWA2_42_35]
MGKIRILALSFLGLGIFVGYFNLAYFLFGKNTFNNFPFQLGLDLKGGAHLVYQADTSVLKAGEVGDAMVGLRDVIERRINIFGIAEPVVQIEKKGDDNRLIVELAGVKDINQAIKMIGETPFLEFRTQQEIAEVQPLPQAPPEVEPLLNFVPTSLTGRYLKKASFEFDQTALQSAVLLEFNNEGQEIFAQLTRENIGKPLAIFLDGQPISIPVVREEIASGRAQITGEFTLKEAKLLVGRLNSGALPVPIQIIAQETVGASLGNEALEKGVRAGIFGIMTVILFLIFWYRLPGFLGALALGIYIGLVLMIFRLLPITLTTAGIAGFILSVGMAVDANILIFERFKEERRAGKGLESSLREGFSRAWSSIRDSNVSSLITCLILYWFGTSIVRGFALTLAIGILFSMFSAITITRVFLLAFRLKETNKLARFVFGSGFKY